MSSTFVVVFDACVLYSQPLRDVLLQLATTELFRARWTHRIQDEWIRALTRERPELAARLQTTRAKMNMAVLDCLVEGCEDIADGLKLPDPNDRHVLAAAIHCGAQVIVTKNLKHFPANYVAKYGIEAQHPDEFISGVMSLYPYSTVAVCAALRTIRARLKKPPYSVDEYLSLLERQGLVQTVAELNAYREQL
jgi:hypothetical protein